MISGLASSFRSSAIWEGRGGEGRGGEGRGGEGRGGEGRGGEGRGGEGRGVGIFTAVQYITILTWDDNHDISTSKMLVII